MHLISISGLDGSGKTTQIQQLKHTLTQANIRVLYFHAVAFSIANKLSFKHSKGNADNAPRAVTRASSGGIALRKVVLFFDILRFHSMLRAVRNTYDVILTDRYFYDQLINIMYLENRSTSLPLSKWQRFLLNQIPKPDLGLYLQVNPQAILTRDRTIEQGRKYLEEKFALFEAYSNSFGLVRVSGERTIDEVSQSIHSLLPLTLADAVKNRSL